MTHFIEMSGKKLLVADDSLTIQKVIRLALSHEGYDIQAVADGPEALEQLMLFRPDVVLIDVSLPGKSAVEVKAGAAERVELQDVRFVLMSSAFEQVDESIIEKAGFHGRLTKPFDPAHLRRVLTEALAFESRSSPSPSEELPAAVPPLSTKEWQVSTELDASEDLAPPPLPKPSSPPIQPPPFHGATPTAKPDAEADIRVLTQSTLKLAGFDDFEWTVSEGARKEDLFEPFDMEPSLPPLPRMGEGPEPSKAMDTPLHESTRNLEILTNPGTRIEPEPEPLSTIHTSRSDLSPTGVENATVPENIEALLERKVREQVEETLAKMSRELLPNLAERLIKQEIHRLLSEGP